MTKKAPALFDAFSALALAFLAFGLPASTAHAAWPEKPIRFIVPSAAGGSPDVLMRVMTNEMSKQMGVAIVVDNKPGASFTIGTAGLPREVQARLTAEIRKALAAPTLIERYKALDTEIDGGTSEEFTALVRKETPKWADVIRRANVKVD